MQKIKILSIVLFFVFSHAYAQVNINFPNLGANFKSGASEYAEAYSKYADVFGKYYAPAIGFSSHMSSPSGKDSLGMFPSFSFGFGLGTSFASVIGIKASIDTEVLKKTTPSILPSLGMSLNLGVGITRSWSASVSIFPAVEVGMPLSVNDLKASLKYGNIKARTTYTLVDGPLFFPGVTIAGYINWTQGNVKLKYDNISSTNYKYDYNGASADASLTYNLASKIGWNFFGAGVELRAWYNLMFFYPYIGYGLGLQSGRLTSDITVSGDITVTLPAPISSTQTDTGTISTSASNKPPGVLQRIIVGFEINLIVFRLGVEAQVDTVTRMAGVGLGTRFVF